MSILTDEIIENMILSALLGQVIESEKIDISIAKAMIIRKFKTLTREQKLDVCCLIVTRCGRSIVADYPGGSCFNLDKIKYDDIMRLYNIIQHYSS
jgi:hypothetical protein